MATAFFGSHGGQSQYDANWKSNFHHLNQAQQHQQHQQQAQQQQQHPQQQQHAVASQQNFGRMAALSNASATNPPHSNNMNSTEHQPSILGSNDPATAEDNRRTLEWIAQLLNPSLRETALLELSKKREQVPELALVLWHSFGLSLVVCGIGIMTNIVTGVLTALLQEIISVYPLLNPSQLTAASSNRVCNALALLQCVASHNDTRQLFLNGTISIGTWLKSQLIDASTYSSFPVSVPQYNVKVKAL